MHILIRKGSGLVEGLGCGNFQCECQTDLPRAKPGSCLWPLYAAWVPSVKSQMSECKILCYERELLTVCSSNAAECFSSLTLKKLLFVILKERWFCICPLNV